jgi:hypothetical protein
MQRKQGSENEISQELSDFCSTNMFAPFWKKMSIPMKIFSADELEYNETYKAGFMDSEGDFCVPNPDSKLTLLGRENGTTRLLIETDFFPSLDNTVFEVDRRKAKSIFFIQMNG